MAQKIKRTKTEEEQEEEELQAFLAQQKKDRTNLLKKVGIIIVCVALVFAFCLPSIASLI